jgi:hypothetical protein
MFLRPPFFEKLQFPQDHMSLRTKIKIGSSSGGMEENVFHLLLHLSLGPSGMLLAQACRLEFTGGPIQRKRHPQLLHAAHPAKDGGVFRR